MPRLTALTTDREVPPIAGQTARRAAPARPTSRRAAPATEGDGLDEVAARLRTVKRPAPILSRDAEAGLTRRQRELLDRLGALFDHGFADLTMVELAGQLNCSLRTLYLLAPSRDDLVLTVVDRNLWRVGRSAREAMRPGMSALDAVRAYLNATTLALLGWTAAFSRDLASMPAAQRLRDEHDEYVVAVTKTLLDLAVERGEIGRIDTSAVGRVLGTLGRMFTRPEIISTLRISPQAACDELVDIIVLGLQKDLVVRSPRRSRGRA
jgi:AcrR family transcriptional regulator